MPTHRTQELGYKQYCSRYYYKSKGHRSTIHVLLTKKLTTYNSKQSVFHNLHKCYVSYIIAPTINDLYNMNQCPSTTFNECQV